MMHFPDQTVKIKTGEQIKHMWWIYGITAIAHTKEYLGCIGELKMLIHLCLSVCLICLSVCLICLSVCLIYLSVCRPLRDDEVLPVRQHRIVPAPDEEKDEEAEQKEVSHMTLHSLLHESCNTTPTGQGREEEEKEAAGW